MSVESLTERPETLVRLYDENTGLWKFVRKNEDQLKSLRIIEGILLRLGLSKNEIKVYVYLAKSGERKAREVSKTLSLHRTETYRILRDLEKRGLVLSVFEKPLKFIATPFEKAIDTLIEAKKLKIEFFEKEKKNLVDMWLSLPQPGIEPERREVFQVLEGKEQVDLKANEILNKTRKEIHVFAPESDLARLYHSGFIDKLERFSRKNLDIRLLTNYSPRNRLFLEEMNFTNVKCSFSNVEDLPSFMISDEEELLFSIKNYNDMANESRKKKRKITALWTNYDAFIKALKTLFLELWNTKVPLLSTKPLKNRKEARISITNPASQ